MRTVFALLGCLSLSACATGVGFDDQDTPFCDHPLRVSDVFDGEEYASLEAATARWNAVSDEKFCLIRKKLPAGIVKRAIVRVPTSNRSWQYNLEHIGYDLKGLYFPESDCVAVPEGLPKEELYGVVLHELGHALGLQHIAAPAVMADRQGSAVDFTENDLAECRRVGVCE